MIVINNNDDSNVLFWSDVYVCYKARQYEDESGVQCPCTYVKLLSIISISTPNYFSFLIIFQF